MNISPSKDVLLINLPVSNSTKHVRKETNSFPPLGLLYIASSLEQSGISVRVIDFAVVNLSKDNFLGLLAEVNPDIVGLSTYNESWHSQKVIARLIRQFNPDIKIVAGGAFATFCYEDVFRESEVDYVLMGEGEYSFRQLAQKILCDQDMPETSIPGLVYRDRQGNIRKNHFERIKDLDALPFPDLSLVNMDDYAFSIAMTTARGCPGECIFCSAKSFYGGKIYFRSADNILEEILTNYEKYQCNIFYFTDDTFTFHKRRAIEFCEKLLATRIPFVWACESRADVLDDEAFVKLLADAGCSKMQIGLESGNDAILKKLKKKITTDQIETAVRLTRAHGIAIQISYIIGHAFDTIETMKQTINYVRYLERTYHVVGTSSINTPFPGTEQFYKAEEYGMKILSNDWNDYTFINPIISTKEFTPDILRYYFELSNKTGEML